MYFRKSSGTLVIAEAGVNHNGDIDTAKRMIEAASDGGADYVKFQTFRTECLTTKKAPKAVYQKQSQAERESQFAMLSRLEISRDFHEDLIKHCIRCGIDFLSTAFDRVSLMMLAELNTETYKIPSGEITNLPYLEDIGSMKKEVLLSTGMASLGEIEMAVDILETAGTNRENITVLHCNTEYPTPMEDVNLNAMVTMGKAFGVKVGYSDHTPGIEIPIAAVALGATVIEKHFTLDRGLPGPDHRASLEPEELKAMVKAIRNVEKARGDGIKRCTPSEKKNREVVRKSVVAKTSIRKGDLFTEENLTAKRPGNGVSPMRWREIVGRTADRDYSFDELIEI